MYALHVYVWAGALHLWLASKNCVRALFKWWFSVYLPERQCNHFLFCSMEILCFNFGCSQHKAATTTTITKILWMKWKSAPIVRKTMTIEMKHEAQTCTRTNDNNNKTQTHIMRSYKLWTFHHFIFICVLNDRIQHFHRPYFLCPEWKSNKGAFPI